MRAEDRGEGEDGHDDRPGNGGLLRFQSIPGVAPQLTGASSCWATGEEG